MRPVDPKTYPAFLRVWPEKETERPTEQTPTKQLTSAPAAAWLVGDAPPEAAAKVEPLNNPNRVTSGAQFIIFDWTRPEVHVILDGMHLKNIIVKNAKIYYSGGPILLENVYFVNCTFEGVTQQLSGQDFAKALFNAASMTFRES
jgi:uncharacterized protein YjbI with pentapeptide repeats